MFLVVTFFLRLSFVQVIKLIQLSRFKFVLFLLLKTKPKLLEYLLKETVNFWLKLLIVINFYRYYT